VGHVVSMGDGGGAGACSVLVGTAEDLKT